MGSVSIPVEGMLWIAGTLLQLAVMFGAFRLWQGQTDTRLKSLEGQTEKVDRIAPVEAELSAFKEQIGVEFKHLREDVREMGRSMHALAVELAKARAATG